MEKKKRFKMPHAYVIIFMMTVITAILANIIPAGTFDRVEGSEDVLRSWLPYSLLCRYSWASVSGMYGAKEHRLSTGRIRMPFSLT